MTLLNKLQTNWFAMDILHLLHDEARLLQWMAYSMIAIGIIVSVALYFVDAPYGRYSSKSWGFLIPGRLAWFVQELPSFVCGILYFFLSAEKNGFSMNTFILLMYTTHYFQRTFIFPYLIRGGKPTPLIPFLMALIFCMYNGYMQGCYHAKFANYASDRIFSAHFILGVFMFASGMAINIHSDHILRNLRKPGEKGYKIPRGGMFEYVSGANFLGEIMEWWGFALAAWSLPALAFAIFTSSNIGPRAISHHQWYCTKFGAEYPRQRKALVPGLF